MRLQLAATFLLPLLLTGQFLITAPASQRSSASDKLKLQRAEKAADSLIQRFRETLDFGVPYREMSVFDPKKRRRAALMYLEISRQLADRSKTATLERAFIALMNFYYLNMVYDLNMKPLKSDKPSREFLPEEIVSAMKESPYFKFYLESGACCDDPPMKSSEELERFISDAERLAGLYRKYMPQNPFGSPMFRENMEYISHEDALQIERAGFEEFGIREGVEVYRVERGFFIFFFTEDRGVLKLLAVGMGN